jgi:mannan endo-1,4-beta-mannosidase
MRKYLISIQFIIFLVITLPVFAGDDSIKPVTPNASPEAVQLLEYLHSISGKNILTGQHCVPLVGSTRLAAVQKMVHKYPAVFGQDFGFSEPGTWDGINFRQQIVDEAIRRNSEGFIITLMWHQVRPLDEEPVDFKESVQGELSVEEWEQLVTPGTALNERWKSQVDVIAFFLKQLKYAGVPVLWRPYHEMNGGWFWWGKKEGENGYKKLYQMLFDRLVNFHKLNNLIWVYNCNEVKLGVDSYKTYYPGDDYVDVVATDVYTEGFNQSNYDSICELAKDKLIALGEVGQVPSLEVIREQPRWVWFMVWGDGGGRSSQGSNPFFDVYKSDEAISLDELPWVTVKEPKVHYPILK